MRERPARISGLGEAKARCRCVLGGGEARRLDQVAVEGDLAGSHDRRVCDNDLIVCEDMGRVESAARGQSAGGESVNVAAVSAGDARELGPLCGVDGDGELFAGAVNDLDKEVNINADGAVDADKGGPWGCSRRA